MVDIAAVVLVDIAVVMVGIAAVVGVDIAVVVVDIAAVDKSDNSKTKIVLFL